MFNRTSQISAIDDFARTWPAPRDPLPAVREATYEALWRAFGETHPTKWPDPRDFWARTFKINPLLKRMNASGHPIPSKINLDAFVSDRRYGQGREDAGGYFWRSWMAGFGWVVERPTMTGSGRF